MGTPGTRGRVRGEEARERLLVAGTRLVAEQGIEAINTNVIARAAGVGVGTFYGHFDDKHALHRAVVARGLEVVRHTLADAHGQVAEQDIEAQVRAGVAAFVDLALARPEVFRTAFSTGPAGRPGAPGGTGNGHGARGTSGRRGAGEPRDGAAGPRFAALGLSSRPVEARLRALQRTGDIDPAIDAAVAARAFTEMQVRTVQWWLDAGGAPGRDALVETLVRMHPALACRIR